VEGLVMPKILTSYLIDEWTYGWRAHRQGHTSGVETTESTKLLEELGVVGKSVYVVRTHVHQISNLFFSKKYFTIQFSRITFGSSHLGVEPSEQPLLSGTANPLLKSLTPFHRLISLIPLQMC
jgi:hypothetical protein